MSWSLACACLGLLVLLGPIMGCDDRVSFPDVVAVVDDDDVADDDDVSGDDDTADDDDATDDDDAADDDDASGDDDASDDDDSTDPPPMLDGLYCLDWSSVDVVEPDGLWELLITAGAALDSSTLIMSVTNVDLAGQLIWFDAGVGDDNCIDAGGGLSPLSPSEGDAFVPPHFDAGPGTLTLGGNSFSLPLQQATVVGDFTASADQIVDSTVAGALNLSGIFGACALLSCEPCPSGGNECVSFAADSATWNRSD